MLIWEEIYIISTPHPSKYKNNAAVNATGYDGQVAADMNTRFMACHGAAEPRAGVWLDTFENAPANAAALKAALTEGSMPVREIPASTTPAPLPSVTTAPIVAWLGDGVTPPVEADYATVAEAFFTANCVSCHGTTNPRNGVCLDSYAEVSARAVAIKAALEGGAMPVTETPASRESVALKGPLKPA